MKVLLLVVFVQVVRAASSNHPTNDGPASLNHSANDGAAKGGGIINMINLGNVDGKSYFYENTRLNWTDSQAYCREFGMELAVITTEEQFAFLKSKYNSTTFNNWYWIGATDSKQLSALHWSLTNSEIILPSGITWEHHGPNYMQCGTYYYYYNGGPQYIQSYACSIVASSIGTLCET
ncbi:C-type lectin domain family 4 member M [Orchesella cincta]|uniref:C-type lectin domain family 4 member M n=1 Tax=Orchesella cincta TaxID=48709 RepID=A0A1D2M3K1_ORCCI|nr:C-type lectin domain family 4 member M [Orchesella cincta]